MSRVAEPPRGWGHRQQEQGPEQGHPDLGPRLPMDSPALPPPHLPLRKASASRLQLQARKGAVPKPLFPTHNHHLRGFTPFSHHPPAPHIDHVQASDEHAFAGRDTRRHFQPAVGMLESQQDPSFQHQHQHQYPHSDTYPAERDGGRPPSSPLLPPPESPHFQAHAMRLKHSHSLGESLRSRVGSAAEVESRLLTPDLPSYSTMQPPSAIRESFRSALTSDSSLLGPSSSVNTSHTSVSSESDFVKVTSEDWEDAHYGDVDDLLDAYGDGFESDAASFASKQIHGNASAKNSIEVRSVRSFMTNERAPSLPRSQSLPRPQAQLTPKKSRFELESVRDSLEVQSVRSLERAASQPKSNSSFNNAPRTTPNTPTKRQNLAHRRSQSASILILGVPRLNAPGSSPANVPEIPPTPSFIRERSSVQIVSGRSLRGTDSRPNSEAIPRDRYGFKKASHYITVEAYDAWNATYTPHLERRSKKWHALMRSYGLSTRPGALRFPPKSDKIKRYVRKGIPPEFRGNAWFWYAGGPGKLAKNPGLYGELLQKVENGGLGDTDREHIERDLQRTFPDNVKFKADIVEGINGGDSVKTGGSALRDSGAVVRGNGRESSATTGSTYAPVKSSMLRDSSATTGSVPPAVRDGNMAATVPVRDSNMSNLSNPPLTRDSNLGSIPARPGPPTRDSSTPPIIEEGKADTVRDSATPSLTPPVLRDTPTPPIARDSPSPSILNTPPKIRDSNATGSTTLSKYRQRLAKDAVPETPIIQSLRRVLQAFAVHNPQIGYCQSLNFIAGLLLLFLDMDEEKSFILLEIITSQHLPGTHGIALEGANIDIGVLMSCIKDSLPAVWAKLDDNEGEQRLPTVSLATTAWFMSLFVGTLPIESVLRVWDCLFFEGSKTLFRVAMSIFKSCESQVVGLGDPMEVFQLVQSSPRGMLDANGLMEQCFRRRAGFGGISQGLIEGRRAARREAVKNGAGVGDERLPGNTFGKLRGRLRSTRRTGRRIETG
ncbi:uncharacterized protein RCC_02341 [Ramularia collo-cygni]|uniref:Rab-GAP TBC domain-containing protein n=1 Tax=Ramularia collo-cygni TaxID=112498 RepID=A0A2D3V4T5_9PEZI|nr:uncharacterized protein RCC_02341 [Ramularia collo-cygni]CZT16499.1 uncharacterized protein RCC_02341 [Ramularia collo-cygni]